VVGAGIGGLCTAIGLQRAGAEVTVLERAAAVRGGGSGLSIFANGVRALETLGVSDRFRTITTTDAAAMQGGQRRPDGRWLAVVPAGSAAGLRIVHRADLHAMLLAAVSPGAVRCGVEVLAATADGTLCTADSPGAHRREQFDLIVAADGAGSTIRARWPADPGIRYAGYSAWRAVTAHPVNLYGQAGETWGSQTRFGIAPLPDGRVYWFAAATMAARPPRSARDEHTELLDRFGSWHTPIPELLAATDPAAISFLPINELTPGLPSFRRARCILLGDAAHAMTPNLGQGGGQAMEDAATLAALLTPYADQTDPDPVGVDAALDRYDRLRRPRTHRIAHQSRRLGQLAHLPGRTGTTVRNIVLWATPQNILARQVCHIHQWHPPAITGDSP
jgi:2-polyprenyl-6-methoxyphenol hydroxylase-like FAD-dependent oxidoreductase